MTLQTRDACGFNNGQAKLTYSFDDASTPPTVEEVRLINNGPAATFNVELRRRTDNVVVRTFTHPAGQGADQTLNRAAIVAQFGDVRMVDVTGHDGSHGWDFPYFYRCWTS